MHSAIAVLLIALALNVSGEPSFDPILPPAYPLAVRNPYLSVWLPGNQAADLPRAVPQFWNGQNLTWSIITRIDGESYSLFGVPDLLPGMSAGTLLRAEYTSTHTTFRVTAGAASFTLDFFSPVSPKNYERQSLPLSYLTVTVSGLEGATPSIQIYSDIDNSWIGQFGANLATGWTYATSQENTQIFTLSPREELIYSELDDRAQWGSAVYCTQQVLGTVAAQVGDISAVREGFITSGKLTSDWKWEAGSVVAFSHDLGIVADPINTTFIVGYMRESVVNYMNDGRADYGRKTMSDINSACVHAFLDLHTAETESRALDAEIVNRAVDIAGTNYSNILSLSVRQAFGALDITIPEDTLDVDDVMVFVKEISSNGNVNTVDVIMPLSPMFYVLAPEYLRLTLEPVMRYLDTGAWPWGYMIHDIGTHYPNATGHNDGVAEPMPVEECGNILILAYMYQSATGNTDWVQQYSSLLRTYADYLVKNGLYPAAQLSSDDGAGPQANQSELAIKSAIALNAYGTMTGLRNYSQTGRQFADTIYAQGVGTSRDRSHFTLTMSGDTSFSMAYNIFFDILLDLGTFDPSAYIMQTNYYPSVRKQLGVPLDSRVDWAKTDWMHFAAAVASAAGVRNDEVRDLFLGDVHAFITNGLNQVPFSDKFFVETNGSNIAGTFDLYRARPVVGGHFALMALNGPNQI